MSGPSLSEIIRLWVSMTSSSFRHWFHFLMILPGISSWGILFCWSVSRSRIVTVLESTLWSSTTRANGVPTSSDFKYFRPIISPPRFVSIEIFLKWAFKSANQIQMVTSMLVTDVGDEMCWWQVWDVGDRFKNHQHNKKVANITQWWSL